MKKLTILALIIALSLTLTACVTSSNNTNTGVDTSDSPLVGTWYQREGEYHGNALLVWSFGEDGRFAYLFSAYEPPQAGGTIDSSVRERFMQGMFRENGNTIELYDIRLDDYFSWGDKWRYFPDRDPALLADVLLTTSLKQSKKVDDLTVGFEFSGNMTLRLEVDFGEWPDQYVMVFDYVGSR